MKEHITAIIVDDEPEARSLLGTLLNDLGQVKVVASAASADDAIPLILKHKPDILFLDVEMPGKTGFDLIAELKRYDIDLEVVFVTAYDKYAIEAIRNAAFDYLLKPVGPEDLVRLMSRYQFARKEQFFRLRAHTLLSNINQKKICFHTREGMEYIFPTDIICCRADGNYTEVCCTGGHTLFVSLVISKVAELLPDEQFFRVSRSDIINITYLTKINRKEKVCILSEGSQKYKLDISKTNLQQLIDKLDKLIF